MKSSDNVSPSTVQGQESNDRPCARSDLETNQKYYGFETQQEYCIIHVCVLHMNVFTSVESGLQYINIHQLAMERTSGRKKGCLLCASSALDT